MRALAQARLNCFRLDCETGLETKGREPHATLSDPRATPEGLAAKMIPQKNKNTRWNCPRLEMG